MKKYDYYVLFDDCSQPVMITQHYDAICNFVINNALVSAVKDNEYNLYAGKYNDEKLEMHYIQQDLLDDLSYCE